jgi:hypothetical protein
MTKARDKRGPDPIKSLFKLDNNITHELKKYNGQPSKSRRQRALVSKSSPHHFIFGTTLPVWKTWQTYAQNMGLLEDEDHQVISQA